MSFSKIVHSKSIAITMQLFAQKDFMPKDRDYLLLMTPEEGNRR